MMPTANYDKRFHFYTNDGKEKLNVSCFHGLLNAQNGLRENQYIRAFLGFIELGVIEVLEELEVVRIGGRGLSRFTSEKIPDSYWLIELQSFNKMLGCDISLEEFLQTALPEVTFHVGCEEESANWAYYSKAPLCKYIRYSHPLRTNEEMQKMREEEKRIIFWDLKARSREKLWFAVVGDNEPVGWETRSNIENAEDLREACRSHKWVIAFLGNILIGDVWYQEIDDFFMLVGTDDGELGKVFLDEEECFALTSEQVNAFLSRDISLEEFVYIANCELCGEQPEYEIEIAGDAQRVWQLIQDGWSYASRVKDLMSETGYINTSPEQFSEECRVIFVRPVKR